MLEILSKKQWMKLFSCIENFVSFNYWWHCYLLFFSRGEYLQCIPKILSLFREIGFKINLKKCEFGKNWVQILGHIVRSGKHSSDPEKIKSILKLSWPTTKNEIRSFLASCCRNHVPRFSQLVLLSTNFTNENVSNNISWDYLTENIFLKEERFLCPLDLEYPFLLSLFTAIAIGACLDLNNIQKEEITLAFFSKKLTHIQMKWFTIQNGLLCAESTAKFDI